MQFGGTTDIVPVIKSSRTGYDGFRSRLRHTVVSLHGASVNIGGCFAGLA